MPNTCSADILSGFGHNVTEEQVRQVLDIRFATESDKAVVTRRLSAVLAISLREDDAVNRALYRNGFRRRGTYTSHWHGGRECVMWFREVEKTEVERGRVSA